MLWQPIYVLNKRTDKVKNKLLATNKWRGLTEYKQNGAASVEEVLFFNKIRYL